MNIFEVLKNLYTNRKCDWISELDETEVQPYVIQRWLAMNDKLRVQVRWLDKYVFVLPKKMYLSLAWSIIPKLDRMPFVKYIKQIEEEEEFDFLIKQVRKHLQLSDNDYNAIKYRLINIIKNDMANWFSYYGVKKRFWKKYGVDFNLIKEFGKTNVPDPQHGLDKWGM